jgi:Domain of unknown function (DUF222)
MAGSADGLFLGRDSRLPLFAQGRPGDQAAPNAWQLMVLADVSGPDDSCPGATDDEALGILGQWGAAGSWLESRKLGVIREMIRRRPSAGNVGTVTSSGLPWEWDDRLASELALQLSVSVPAARKLLWTAWSLEARLPGIGAALADGRLDPSRARMVIEETNVLLEPGKLAAAEQIILDGMGACKTWMDLQRLVQRAVVAVDPDGARKRREQEEKENARIRFWREAAGTCALLGTGLPTDEALAAHANVEQRAQAYRAEGVKRPIDILRVAAYLDILNGVPMASRLARFQTEDEAQATEKARQDAADAKKAAAAKAAKPRPARGETKKANPEGTSAHDDGYPWDSPPGDRFSSPEDPCGGCTLGNCFCRDWTPSEPSCERCGREACSCGNPGSNDGRSDGDGDGPGGGSRRPGPGSGTPGSGAHDPSQGFASEVNLTLRHVDIPLLTAFGAAQRPGEARSLGTLDHSLAQRLAEAAARHPNSAFCITIVNEQGYAIGHGCCKPLRRARKGKDPLGHGPPETTFTITPTSNPGPPGGFGSWLLTLPGRTDQYVVDLHPVPTEECGHQYETAGHDPGDLLRHLIQIRDGKCGFPVCSRRAKESDLEHATPHHEGGRSCGCNCWTCSRSCHQLKQSDGWIVTKPRPGWKQWRTPAGRIYVQDPWRYPS